MGSSCISLLRSSVCMQAQGVVGRGALALLCLPSLLQATAVFVGGAFADDCRGTIMY